MQHAACARVARCRRQARASVCRVRTWAVCMRARMCTCMRVRLRACWLQMLHAAMMMAVILKPPSHPLRMPSVSCLLRCKGLLHPPPLRPPCCGPPPLRCRCIAFLLLLVVLGVVAIIVVKVLNPKQVASAIKYAACNTTVSGNATLCDAAGNVINSTVSTMTGRRMVSAVMLHLLAEDAS